MTILAVALAGMVPSIAGDPHSVEWCDARPRYDPNLPAMGNAPPPLSVGPFIEISSLTDPPNPAIEGFVDITSARIEQNGNVLKLAMEVREPIPTTLPLPTDGLTYIFLIDTDLNSGTGQPHGNLGSEFNVRAVVSQQFGGGFVDVTGSEPGGGGGQVNQTLATIEILIGLSQVGSPAQFNWRADAFGTVNGLPIPSNGETTIAFAEPLPAPPAPAYVSITPYLLLSPADTPNGQVEVQLRDASGNALDPADYLLLFWSGDPNAISVDSTGLVTAHALPNSGRVDIYASADGHVATNQTRVRVNNNDVGVDYALYEGTHVALAAPLAVDGVDLDAITQAYAVVPATDLAYLSQESLTGVRPFEGGMQYFAVDVTDDPVTAPCGTAGNPFMLGWLLGGFNCYLRGDGAPGPTWFILWHELGHNFTLTPVSFNEFAWSYPPHAFTYVEGLASHAAMWSMISAACNRTLDPFVTASIEDELLAFSFRVRTALEAYRAAGSDYDAMDPDVVDGILLELLEDYGLESWYDFFSTFLPANEPLPCLLDSREKQATWVVAAFTASTELDLRGRFSTDYGFPIDEQAWPDILRCVQTRIKLRSYTTVDQDLDGVLNQCDACDGAEDLGDANADGGVDLDDYLRFVQCHTGPGGTVVNGCQCMDFNGDGDVDLVDFAGFQASFTK